VAATKGQTLELAVLGLLHEAPMHGYELRKRLNLMFGWGRVLSYGSLYPTLEEDAAQATGSRRPTRRRLRAHPVSKRPRIVYQVTEAGTREFQRLDVGESGPTALGGRQLRHPLRLLLLHRHGDPPAGPRRSARPDSRSASTRVQSPAVRHHARRSIATPRELQRHGVRVAIVGVGNCAASLCRASSTTRTPTRSPRFRG
jgi:DNA-binding PadR family transcriptional regulator